MAEQLIKEFHPEFEENKLRIDLLFAYGEKDDAGEIKSPALKKNGVKALGITRKINLKDRTKGLGDAEICLDGDWWEEADEAEKKALLDHELHHIIITADTDMLRRPLLRLRKHDFEIGWFAVIAQRHGSASQERIQAKAMMDRGGQYFWPEISEIEKSRAILVSTIPKSVKILS